MQLKFQDSPRVGKSVKGTADKRKTGLTLSKQLATFYAQGTPNTLRVMLYQKHPTFLGFGIKF